MNNKISTFRKDMFDIIAFVGGKFGFYLSLDFTVNPKFRICSGAREVQVCIEMAFK